MSTFLARTVLKEECCEGFRDDAYECHILLNRTANEAKNRSKDQARRNKALLKRLSESRHVTLNDVKTTKQYCLNRCFECIAFVTRLQDQHGDLSAWKALENERLFQKLQINLLTALMITVGGARPEVIRLLCPQQLAHLPWVTGEFPIDIAEHERNIPMLT